MNASVGVVTVWSDIGCPWATFCLNVLREAGARRQLSFEIDHRAFPLELINRTPTPKGIVDAEVVALAPYKPEMRWRFWTGPADTYPVTMLPALEAVQAAKDASIGGLRGSDELDGALRSAFYVDNRCISIPSVILEVASSCANVDHDALADALAVGTGRAEVYAQWRVAAGSAVQGSPHVFLASGINLHNPGVQYHWTELPPLPQGYGPQGGIGLPKIESIDQSWADQLLDEVGSPS